MKLFDSHAHYFDSRLDGLGGADKVLSEEVFGKEVERLVNVGTSYKSSLLAVGQAKKYDGMYAAVGVHPEDARELPDDPKEELTLIRSLLENKAENKISKNLLKKE